LDKKPSGAEFKKRRRKAGEQARIEESARRAGDTVDAAPHLASYRALGEPPTDDPTMGLVYAQNCMLVALREVVTDPILESEKRWKLISQLGGQIGVTHAKALVQHKLDKVTKKLDAKKDVSGGPRKLDALAKPATARGGASRRVEEPADRPLLGPSPGEDEGVSPTGGGPVGQD
jgi:hypothetical protein